jgi:spermidine synthase
MSNLEKPKGCDAIMNGWFSELSEFWPGQALSLEVDSVLHHEQTEYQDLLVFKSKAYGNVLVLDGAIQATERDEFSYQEMITHLPMCGHPNPKRALVIGGGDGGVLRELSRHPGLEEIVICELDQAVPAASRKFLPQMAVGFDDPRVTVHFMDGAEYMNSRKNYFDVIITDSSDPVGPASVLFEKPFYTKMRDALRPGGIVCTQVPHVMKARTNSSSLSLVARLRRRLDPLPPPP